MALLIPRIYLCLLDPFVVEILAGIRVRELQEDREVPFSSSPSKNNAGHRPCRIVLKFARIYAYLVAKIKIKKIKSLQDVLERKEKRALTHWIYGLGRNMSNLALVCACAPFGFTVEGYIILFNFFQAAMCSSRGGHNRRTSQL